MSTGFAERFAAAVRRSGKSFTDIAVTMDVTRSAVGHWASGRRDPDADTMQKLAAELGVGAGWLAFGEGEGPAIEPLPEPPVILDGCDGADRDPRPSHAPGAA